MADYSPYVPMFEAAGKQWNIDPDLLHAIARAEAGIDDRGNPQTSRAGARGIMQFIPSTAKEYGVNPDDAYSSIVGAAHKMSDLLQYYGGDVPSALAAYNGSTWDAGQKYAAAVANHYKTVTAQPAPAPTPAGQTVTEREAQLPPQRNISPNEHGPDYFSTSVTPGSQKNYPIADGGASLTMNPAPSDQPPQDFRGALFGKPSPEAPQTSSAPPPAAPSAEAAGEGDFRSKLFGATPPSPAPEAPAAAPALTPSSSAPPSAAAAPIPAPPKASDYTPVQAPPDNALTPPPQPSWWQRNVAIPAAAAEDPRLQTAQPFLNQPFLQSILAGANQGVRDVGSTLNNVSSWLDQNVPGFGALDRAIGFTPEVAATAKAQAAGETQAYEKQYGGDYEAMGGRFGGNLLAAPVGGAGRAIAAPIRTALPDIGRYVAPVVDWATQGGLQNMLTSGGDTVADWLHNLGTGAAGGAALGAAMPALGAYLSRATTALQRTAQDLGFNLSVGDLRGGLAKGIESVTQYLPWSGNNAYQAANRANVNRILNRNMGVTGDAISADTMQQAMDNAGRLMDRIDNVTIRPQPFVDSAGVRQSGDPDFLTRLADLHQAATDQQLPAITRQIDRIQDIMAAHNGTLPGNLAHDLFKNGTPLDDLITGSDSVLAGFARNIKSAIQNAASRSGDTAAYGADAAANAAAVRDLNQGRYFWKTIQTVLPLVRATGNPDDATYTALANRILGTARNPNFDPMFNRGNNEMADLGQVLKGVLPDLKSSGTGRENIMARLLGIGEAYGPSTIGGGIAHLLAPGSLEGYVGGTVIPALAGGQIGRLMRQGIGPWTNALMPRVAGPMVGNQLMGP